jgi:hypothetical protein
MAARGVLNDSLAFRPTPPAIDLYVRARESKLSSPD